MIGYLCSDVMSQPVTQGMMGSWERLSVKDTEDKARIWRRAGLRTGQPITEQAAAGSLRPVFLQF